MKDGNFSIKSSRSKQQSIASERSVASVRENEGVKGVRTEICVTINRPAEDLFAFWRNFENLPQIMDHIESIKCKDTRR